MQQLHPLGWLLSCQRVPRGIYCCSCDPHTQNCQGWGADTRMLCIPGSAPQPSLTLAHCSIICSLVYIVLLEPAALLLLLSFILTSLCPRWRCDDVTWLPCSAGPVPRKRGVTLL